MVFSITTVSYIKTASNVLRKMVYVCIVAYHRDDIATNQQQISIPSLRKLDKVS